MPDPVTHFGILPTKRFISCQVTNLSIHVITGLLVLLVGQFVATFYAEIWNWLNVLCRTWVRVAILCMCLKLKVHEAHIIMLKYWGNQFSD